MIAIVQLAMRHSKEDKAASHERIVEVAAARIRESGTDQPGVAEIMRAAGLTHGGFYKHFGSRDELIAEAVERALATASRGWSRSRPAQEAYRTQVERYLAHLQPLLGGDDDARCRATVTLSAMVGALMIARALGPTPGSDEILRDVREAVRERRLL